MLNFIQSVRASLNLTATLNTLAALMSPFGPGLFCLGCGWPGRAGLYWTSGAGLAFISTEVVSRLLCVVLSDAKNGKTAGKNTSLWPLS